MCVAQRASQTAMGFLTSPIRVAAGSIRGVARLAHRPHLTVFCERVDVGSGQKRTPAMAEPEVVKQCQACGATIYADQLRSGAAALVNDRLLCAYCLRHPEGESSPTQATDEPIAMLDEGLEAETDASHRSASIRAFGDGGLGQAARRDSQHRRSLLTGSSNATRCRTFHCKLSDASMAHLDEMITEWVDAHDDVEIKFATSSVGVVEGKSADPHLIVTIFY